MARIRTIKPQFFLNEGLADLPAMNRLLFIGLWTQADREGRLVDRPKRLKAEIFPYDNFDLEKGLNQLSDAGFILRYKVNANGTARILAPEQPINELALIQIINFSKHQKIDKTNESESDLPPPGTLDYHSTSDRLVLDGEGKGRERKGKEGSGEPPAPIFKPVKTGSGRNNAGAENFSPPDLAQVKDFFLKNIGDPVKKGSWPAELCEKKAIKFFNFYTANGWRQGSKKPIVNWQAQCEIWIADEREGSFSGASKTPHSPPAKQGLSKVERDINRLYENYCIAPADFEMINIDPLDYDILEKRGRITFLEEKRSEIQKQAQQALKEKKIPVNDTILLNCMKKIAVVEFFKEQLRLGRDVIFKF